MTNDNECKKIHLATPWAVFASILLFIAYSIILVLLFANTNLEWSVIIITFFPFYAFAIFHFFLFLRGITTVIYITRSEIVLKKFGIVIERLHKEDICCIGICSEYYRSSYIFLSTVSYDKFDVDEIARIAGKGLKENRNLEEMNCFVRFMRKMANKKNGGIVLIEHTSTREKYIRDHIKAQWIDLRNKKI